MPFTLSPELAARVETVARTHRQDPHALLEQLIAKTEAADAAFLAEVDEGIAELDAGKFVTHEEVMASIDAIIKAHAPAAE